ncbi:MAG: helix-turn-helix domain-containing protein [Hyphomonas sp.]|nr:helix-turn-helix domain-containing protein [Hyphomonas sp.]
MTGHHFLLRAADLEAPPGSVKRETVIAIELGKYSPSLESAFRVARVFGLGIEDVFGWDGPQKG